jgi:hypothetical protein
VRMRSKEHRTDCFCGKLNLRLYRHLVSDGGDCEVYRPLGHDVACSGRNIPSYRRNALSSSGWKSEEKFWNFFSMHFFSRISTTVNSMAHTQGQDFWHSIFDLIAFWNNTSLASG